MFDRSEELAGVYAAKRRKGLFVALWIGVLTLVEYIVAVALDDGLVWPYLVPLLIAKAWLIADYFMHIRDLGGGDH